MANHTFHGGDPNIPRFGSIHVTGTSTIGGTHAIHTDEELAEKLGRDEHDGKLPPWLKLDPFKKARELALTLTADIWQPGGRGRFLNLLDVVKREHDLAAALRDIADAGAEDEGDLPEPGTPLFTADECRRQMALQMACDMLGPHGLIADKHLVEYAGKLEAYLKGDGDGRSNSTP